MEELNDPLLRLIDQIMADDAKRRPDNDDDDD